MGNSVDSDYQKNVQNNICYYHNVIRVTHNSPPVKLNPYLCDIAQSYADKISSSDFIVPSGNTYQGEVLGENIGFVRSENSNTQASSILMDEWMQQEKFYNFNKNDFQEGSGNFTQIVWKDTKEIGVGVKKTGNAEYPGFLIVINYYPSGNIDGLFTKNVSPLNKYIKVVLEEDPNFNFASYYEESPFYANTVEVKGSTMNKLKDIINYIL